MNDNIVVKGAREHNLKNIDITMPKDSIVVISGLSGSGKSSLAFDTVFAEGQEDIWNPYPPMHVCSWEGWRSRMWIPSKA